MRIEEVGREQGTLDITRGSVKEMDATKDFGKYLDECGMREWWVHNMGYGKSGG